MSGVEVANAILEQLGGRKFIVCTGATNLLSLDDERGGLQFRLPARFAKEGINSVRIVLDASDTYSVTFHRIGRAPSFKIAQVSEVNGVYADSLREVFERHTGLVTSLGTLGAKAS